MKVQHYLLSAITSFMLVLTSCDGTFCGCSDPTPPLKDTEFKIAYKLVDGSWDTLSVVLPKATEFLVEPTGSGTYALFSKYSDVNGNVTQRAIKAAVIDYKMLGDSLVLDTASKKVELIKKHTI